MKSKTKKPTKAVKSSGLSVTVGSDFVRERRYLVVKITDAKKYLSPAELGIVELLATKTALGRRAEGKRDLRCVVVESDWPEYEPTWQAIERRMAQRPHSLVGGNFDTDEAHARAGYPDNR